MAMITRAGQGMSIRRKAPEAIASTLLYEMELAYRELFLRVAEGHRPPWMLARRVLEDFPSRVLASDPRWAPRSPSRPTPVR